MKKLISLLLVVVLLAAMFVVPVAAEIEGYWSEEDAGIADDGTYHPKHAWGYVFDIAEVDATSVVGERNIIITSLDAYVACAGNFQWLTHAYFAPTGEANEYAITELLLYPGTVNGVKLKTAAKVVEAGLVTEEDFADGKFILLSASAASKPMYLEDGSIQYLNWEQKVAVWGLGNTIGAKVTLENVDLSVAGPCENGTMTVEDDPGKVEEPAEPATDKFTIELSDNDTILNKTVDEAVALLTDGDWVLDAGAWGTGTANVVPFQNKNPGNENAYGQINLIYEFAETPEPYNNIKLGLYSDVNVMMGYPSEEDVFFSNDGINWVGGYSNASIGYGETIPDAMTKFDGEATPAGTVVAELKLRNPQTYKYVKVELYFPKSPFTEANGYGGEGNPAKPRWEFFGVTEFEIGSVEPSSVITDFNITEYWESRFGRSQGSFAFTTAADYKVAWDNFITSSYTQVAFAPVEGVENTYEVVVKGNSELTFPEGGFIWTAYNSADAGSYGKAAIDLFADMEAGDQYTFTGIDFEKGFGEKDAAVVKYGAPVEPDEPTPDEPTPDEPVVESTNVALGKDYEISGCGNRGSYYGSITDGNAVMNLSGDNNVNWFGFYNNGSDQSIINAPNGVGYFIIDLEAFYNINNVKVGIIGQPSWGIANPGAIKAYASNDGVEFVEIGEFDVTLATAGVGEWKSIEATDCVARYIKIEVTLAGTFAFVNEVEVYGVESTEEPTPDVPDVPDVPVVPEEPKETVEDLMKEALGEAFADSKVDYVIEAPSYYKAGDEITVTVTVKNITAENGIHVAAFKLYYDNEKLLLTNDLDEEDDNALMCVKTMPKDWENFSTVANDFDPELDYEEEGMEVKPLNDGEIYVQVFTAKSTKTAAAKEDGSIVFEFTFVALEDAEGDIGIVIPHAETEGGYNTATGADVYKASGDYAVIHNAVVVKGYDATCETDGLTDGLYCADCDTWFVAQEVIEALGHDEIAHNGKDATCTAIGHNAYVTCSRCDYTTYEEIAALGHNLVHVDSKAATCEETGHDEYDKCSRCDYSTYVEIPALGHKAEWIVVTEAGVGKEGLKEYKCSVCGEVLDTEVIPALCIIGDANDSGTIDKYDYILVKRAVMGTFTLDDIQSKAADVNSDGKVDKYDYILIKRHVMGTYSIEGTK